MAPSKLMIAVAVIAIASFCVPSTMAQTRHVVGDTTGWIVPPEGAGFYTTWASRQNFTVGDTLVFNFATGMHDVAEVTEAAYVPCNITSPITQNTTSPVNITLTPGNHYYICTFRAGGHCQGGQKLNVTVVNSTASPPPGTTTPPPPGTTTPPPPPPNSGSSFSAVVPVTFLAAALAFFY